MNVWIEPHKKYKDMWWVRGNKPKFKSSDFVNKTRASDLKHIVEERRALAQIEFMELKPCEGTFEIV